MRSRRPSAAGRRAEQKVVLCSLLSSASLSPVRLPPAASSEIFLKYRSCPPGSVQSSLHADVSPTFLKLWTILRGMKTSVPGPSIEVCPSIVSS